MGKLTADQYEWLGPSFSTAPNLSATPENVPDTTHIDPEQSTLSLAAELENPVYNFIDYMSRPVFSYDPEFSGEAFKRKAAEFPLFNEYKTEFYKANSAEEFDYIANQITQSVAKRQQLASRGWAGVAAATAMGILSPTVLLPLVGQARGAKAFATGAGYGLLAAGLDETVLQLNDPGRGPESTMIAVGASTILGGLLGGLVRNIPADRLISIQDDISGKPSQLYIQPSVPTGATSSIKGGHTSINAASSFLDVGELAPAFGAEKLAQFTGPVGRGLGQKITSTSGSLVHRTAVAQLGDGGLLLKNVEDGISGTQGLGTVENNITTYHVHEWKLDQKLVDAYGDYLQTPKGAFRLKRSQFNQLTGQRDKLSFTEFKKEFTRTVMNGDVSPAGIKEIEAIAKSVRKETLEQIHSAAVEAGIFKKLKTLDGDEVAFPDEVVGDISYWMRQWDPYAVANKLDAQGRSFVQKMTRDVKRWLMREFNQIADQAKAGKLLGDELTERLAKLNASSYDLEKRIADFDDIAKQIAEELQEKIMSSGPRMAQFNAVVGRRGSELARMLNVKSADYEDFIEMDPQVALRRYIKTLAPDIELAKRFGDPGMSKYIDDLEQERLAKAEAIMQKEWSPAKKEKRLAALNKQYQQFSRDIETMVERLKHTRGMPENPNTFMERAGRVALGLNSMRMMGNVLPASVADVARVIFKNGVGNTFKFALFPLLRDFKSLKLSALEAKYAGNALDALTHRRSMALLDIFENSHRQSKFEQAVEFGASRIGMVALFDYWTSSMKMLNTAVTNGRVMEAISRIEKARAPNGTLPAMPSKQLKKDLKYLASLNLDAQMSSRIWKQMNGLALGGGKTDTGIWLPNTESWMDAQAKQAYRTALNAAADNTIVTPGIERPSMMDANTFARLVFQFKSFTFASNTRMLLSGLQQKDMAVLSGTLASLALGALSFAIYKATRGEWEEFEDATYEQILDEAIDRSGLLASLALGRDLAQRIPATAEFASLSGERTTRRANQDLLDFALGPSYNTLSTVSKILINLDQPTTSTLHQLRLLLPYQNVFWITGALNKMEEAIGESLNLPETRR